MVDQELKVAGEIDKIKASFREAKKFEYRKDFASAKKVYLEAAQLALTASRTSSFQNEKLRKIAKQLIEEAKRVNEILGDERIHKEIQDEFNKLADSLTDPNISSDKLDDISRILAKQIRSSI